MNTTLTKEEIKQKEKFNTMWDSHQFNWNGKEGQPLNPNRIYNVFILPALEQAKEEERDRIVEDVRSRIVLCKIIFDIGSELSTPRDYRNAGRNGVLLEIIKTLSQGKV